MVYIFGKTKYTVQDLALRRKIISKERYVQKLDEKYSELNLKQQCSLINVVINVVGILFV